MLNCAYNSKEETMAIRIKLMAFDVNQTLADDLDIFIETIQKIFERYQKPAPTKEFIRENFSQPWTKIFRDAEIAEAEISNNQLYLDYNEIYLSYPWATPTVGVKEVLRHLTEHKIVRVIVTTQQEAITKNWLKHWGLNGYFNVLYCGVPDKEKTFKHICQVFSLEANEAAYVGDQIDDVLKTNSAGLISIAVEGLHTTQKLRKAKPDYGPLRDFTKIMRLPIYR